MAFILVAWLKGLSPILSIKFWKRFRHQDDNSGLKLEEDATISTTLKLNEVIIGVDLAHSIGAYPGDRIVINSTRNTFVAAGEDPPYVTLTVQNVIRTNIPELDSQLLYYNKIVSPKLLKMPRVSTIQSKYMWMIYLKSKN